MISHLNPHVIVQFNVSLILTSSSHDLQVVSKGFWYLLVDTVEKPWQCRRFADGSILILSWARSADSNLGEEPPGFQSKITFIHTSCLNQSSFKLQASLICLLYPFWNANFHQRYFLLYFMHAWFLACCNACITWNKTLQSLHFQL